MVIVIANRSRAFVGNEDTKKVEHKVLFGNNHFRIVSHKFLNVETSK